MQTSKLFLLAACATSTSLVACFNLGVCEVANCDGAGGGATTSASSGTSSSTGLPTGCVPSANGGPNSDTCGIFVDPTGGADSNPGTISSPKKTLGSAVSAAKAGEGIFVCKGSLADGAGVSLAAGTVLYGGLDCGGGFKSGAAADRSTLAPSAGAIPMTLLGGSGKTE